MLQTSANIAGNAIKLQVFSTFAEIGQEWCEFQASALMTPYQQYGWLEPWFRHFGNKEDITPVIVYGEISGRPAFIWPFGLQRINGLRVCRWLGGKQCNYNFGLYEREILPILDHSTIKSFLHTISDLAGGIDVFELFNQPQSWNGVANPFAAFEQQASPSPCYRTDLSADFDALEAARRKPQSVRNLRRKTRQLAGSHGEVRLARTAEFAEFAEIFQAFMAQREIRFGEIGIANIFADGGLLEFLKEVARPNGDSTPPILEFHALYAGDKVCATYAGLRQNGHFSCFVNSVDIAEFGKFSPGEIILSGLIKECCEDGMAGFDLGMGTERYKLSWCDEDPLFDCFVPITSLGILQTIKIKTMLSLKRTVRSNPKLWTMAKTVRKHLNGV